MNRSLIQSALCLLLCQMLVAQQVPTSGAPNQVQRSPTQDSATYAPRVLPEFVTIPKNTKIKYKLFNSLSSATVKRGDVIPCLVAEDVIVDGITVLPVGTVVPVVITKAHRAMPGAHDGAVDFRPANIEIGKNFRLRITDDVPESPEERKDSAHEKALIAVTAPLWIPIFPVYVAANLLFDPWGNNCKSCKPEVPEGKDFVFDACFEMTFYVKSAKTIRVADLPAAPAGSVLASFPCKSTPTFTKAVAVAP
jgi:hypothetical protein